MMAIEHLEVEGNVSIETVAAGSKSQRSALTLRTNEGAKYVLQSQDDSGFGVDEALEGLVGRRIKAVGVASNQTLILHHWEALD
jgi:hypothetical protein